MRTRDKIHGHGKVFLSEPSVYRLLKSHNLITSPTHVIIIAADEFKD